MRIIMLVLIVSVVCLSTVQVSAFTATCLCRQQLRQAMIGNAKLRGIQFATTPECGQIRRRRCQAALRFAIIRCKAEGEGGMKAVFDELVGQAKNLASQQREGKQTWIAIGGAPGSGKSTLSTYVARKLNDEGSKTIVVPMDGFHYYRRELDAMPDPVEAHAKRGAHWTFNSRRLVDTLQKIRSTRSGLAPVNFAFPAAIAGHPAGCKLDYSAQYSIAVNLLPSIELDSCFENRQTFDHAEGDPVEDAIAVEPGHEIVIVEGSFLLLGEAPWTELSSLFDEKWFIDCDMDILRERVISRNSAAWNWSYEKTAERVDSNDMHNARLIAATKAYADRVVYSVQDTALSMNLVDQAVQDTAL